MLKSDLTIEPYTLKEALECLNKELNKNFKKKICINHLYNLIYTKCKIPTINIKGKPIMIEYNSIVDLYNHIKDSNIRRYSVNGRKRK
jgi:hypothetical protein